MEEEVNTAKGYLHTTIDSKVVKKQYYKLINKDLFFFKNINDIIHLGIHNLSGAYLKEQSKKIRLENQEMHYFTIIYPHNSIHFFCESDIEYVNWIETIKAVIGYEDLNETYEIKHKLGQGKYGSVNLCVQKKTGREAAIKIISKKAMSPSEYQLVITEIEILKVCQHPNIIKLYDVLENHDFIYISNYILLNYITIN